MSIYVSSGKLSGYQKTWDDEVAETKWESLNQVDGNAVALAKSPERKKFYLSIDMDNLTPGNLV